MRWPVPFILATALLCRTAWPAQPAEDADLPTFDLASPDERFLLEFHAYLQPRYTFATVPQEPDISTFRLRHVRPYIRGHLFRESLKYLILTELPNEAVILLEAYLDWTPLQAAALQVGQYKAPFSRQDQVSTSRLLLVGRSLANNFFAIPRDIGLKAHGLPLSGRLLYEAAVMNGSGINRVNQNNRFLYAGRLVYHPLAPYRLFTETPVVPSPEPYLAVGSSFAFNTEPDEDGTEIATFLADGELYFTWSLLTLQGEYFLRRTKPIIDGEAVLAQGFYVQSGLFLLPRHLQLAGRYSLVDPDDATPDDLLQEATFGVNYYFYGHFLKIQAEYSVFVTAQPTGPTDTDQRVQAQLQLAF